MGRIRATTRKRAGVLVASAAAVALFAGACGSGSDSGTGGGATTAAAGGGGGGSAAAGENIYKQQCATCHGANGEGGVGPMMTTVKTVFPNEADHIEWVKEQGASQSGPYGANNSGNAGKGAVPGSMPKFGDTLSEDDIKSVVAYEREKLAK